MSRSRPPLSDPAHGMHSLRPLEIFQETHIYICNVLMLRTPPQ